MENEKRSIACTPPTVPQCVTDPNGGDPTIPGSNYVCICAAPTKPVLTCEARVIYPDNDPNSAELVTYPGCDLGVELALAVALAKLLGGK